MSDETKIEPYYQKESKEVVDMLYDNGFFKEGISRDDMKDVENLIAFLFQSHANSAKRVANFTVKWNLKK